MARLAKPAEFNGLCGEGQTWRHTAHRQNAVTISLASASRITGR